MKTIGLFFILSVAMLVSGCYTQLALNNDEAEATIVSEPVIMEQPYPVAMVIEPIFVPIAPPYYPPPAVGVSAPSPAVQPDHAARDVGNRRGPSGRSVGSDTGSRNTGLSRGGR